MLLPKKIQFLQYQIPEEGTEYSEGPPVREPEKRSVEAGPELLLSAAHSRPRTTILCRPKEPDRTKQISRPKPRTVPAHL